MSNTPFPGGLPERYFLQNFHWQLFGTLTFSDERPEWKRRKMFFAIMRQIAKRHHIYWGRFHWVLKQEWGHGAHLPHIHFLTAALPPAAQSKESCRAIHDHWIRCGGGFPKIEPYDPTLNGLDYVLKRTGEKTGVTRSYLGDLEDTGGLTFSESIKAVLNRR